MNLSGFSIQKIILSGLALPIIFAVTTAIAVGGNTTSLQSAEHAEGLRAHYDIPAQALSSALKMLAQTADIQLVYAPDAVGDIQAKALRGEFTPQEALRELLQGTQLTFSHDGKDTIVVKKAAPSAGLDHNQMNSQDKSAEVYVAQTEAPVAPAETGAQEKERGDALEEIVVTAQKREERLVDAPLTVSVLSAERLSNLGATQFRDFADTIPGLSFQSAGPGFTQISIRGVSIGLDSSATVGVYVDDVPYGSSTSFARGGQITFDAGIFDLERIEVLQGPQGTLYGSSTLGGLIKYVTKQPNTRRFGGDAQTGVSSTDGGGINYDVSGSLNAPLVSDRMALRVSGFDNHDGGYIDNVARGDKDANSSDVYGARIDWLFTPTEQLSIRLNEFLQNTSTDGFPTADYSLTGHPIEGSLRQSRAFPEEFEQHYHLASATLNYDFGKMSLASISSYQTTQTQFFVDYSTVVLAGARTVVPATAAVGYHDDSSTDKFTQEVRLASQGTHLLDWVVGGFYTHEKSKLAANYELRDAAGAELPNTVFTFLVPSKYEEYAAFGDLTWHLSQKFDVTGGIRYAANQQTFEQIGAGAFGRTAPPVESKGHTYTYLGNARYHFSDDATGYLRYATGYRPGGPNFFLVDPMTGARITPATFDADTLKSYEAGFKADALNGMVNIDISSFYIDWNNIQLTVTRGGFGARENAPTGATIRGAQLSVTARPIHEWSLAGAVAYQNAKMDGPVPSVGAADGERLPGVPRINASLMADYELPGAWKPTLGATVRYVDDRKNSFGAAAYELPSYTSVDMRGGWTLDRIKLQLFVHNIFDERGQLTPRVRFFPAAGPIQVSILQPRTYGLVASMSF